MTGAGRTELAYEAYDRLSRVGEVGYVFDADGYLTNRGADEFHYGSRGELLEATIGETSYSYTYDALGRRTAREGGQGTIRYYYGHPGALQTVTASIAADGAATQYYYNEEGLLIGFERGGNRYYVITDGVGTPQQVLDASGTVVKELAYDSYGVLLSDSNPGLELPIGFAGGLEDRETGLVRFGARDYDPAAGRWTARDPILFESGQANLYAYVNNNPVEYRDPCGLFCVGFTAYEGIGGGGKVCMTDDGVSACGEIGFGIGGGLEVNPIEDLSKDGLSLEATAKAAFGPASLTLGVKLKDRFRGGCLDADPIAKIGLGPIGYDIADSKKIGVKGGADKLGKSVTDLMKANAKAELALKTKACVSHRW
ncbi:RHS repeat domain-containing protein [Paenibacillus sp. 1P07SE]|uniref:RHS repeat domain-containing protein n=1 Tax=Paenibacillus sp. 1P07SE TaxID=3132209 RepID=UPI0039A58CFA